VPKRVAILQSNYIPWKGYFDLIRCVDEFILYDCVQYTRSDWRNRNRIKTRRGPRWLTIPVKMRGRFGQSIEEAAVADPGWSRSHWDALEFNYHAAPYFAEYRDLFRQLYLDSREQQLSAINRRFISAICDLLGIGTKITRATDYSMSGGPTERLIDLCRAAAATEYVSGPAGRNYLEPGQFLSAGISLSFMSYDGYREYPQLFPPFEHQVSVVDLIFNTGPEAKRFLLYS
jgi:WbqC-like protein family